MILVMFDFNQSRNWASTNRNITKFTSGLINLIILQILITITFKNMKTKIACIVVIPFVATMSHQIFFQEPEIKEIVRNFIFYVFGIWPSTFSLVYFQHIYDFEFLK